eukprot:NODE_477_length_6979_cov_0.820058.p1 type:complete len:1027 gc:universal NODE_477_length_6979_cov_0.820058:914-3994(+)
MLDIQFDPIDQRRLFLLSFLIIWLAKCIYLFSSLSGISSSNYTALFVTLDTIYFSILYWIKIPILYTGTTFQPLSMKITGASILIYGILFNMGLNHFTSGSPASVQHSSSQLPTSVYNPRGQLVSNVQTTSFYGNIHGEYLVTLNQPSYAVLLKKCNNIIAELHGHGPWDVNIKVSHKALNKDSSVGDRSIYYHVTNGNLVIPLNGTEDFGLYNFEIYDRLNLKGKSNSTMMVPCPEANIVASNACQYDDYKFSLDLKGAHPIEYTLKIGKETLSGITKATKKVLDSVSVQIPFSTNSVSRSEIRLAAITDKYNNSIKFHSGHTGPIAHIEVHPQPMVQFENDKEVLLRTNQTAPELIKISATGISPFVFHYEYNGKKEKIEQKSPHLSIPALDAGRISLIAIQDRNCAGKVSQPSSINLKIVQPPTLSFTPLPVKDPCFGQVALKLNLTLTGTPPFWIDYQEDHENRINKNRILVNGYRKIIILEPETSGNYKYTLNSLGDSLYKNGVHINEVFNQYVHPKSFAKFEKQQVTVCTNTGVSLPIKFTGQAPWTLVMDVNEKTEMESPVRKQVTLSNIQSEKEVLSYDFELQFSQPGTYTYDMVKIADKNQCVFHFQEEIAENQQQLPLTITAVQTNPWVDFDTQELEMFMPEGSFINVPVIFSSTAKPPFTVHLEHELNGKSIKYPIKDISKWSDTIKITKEGQYRLSSVNDLYCQGNIASEKVLKIKYYPKPTLDVGQTKPTLCQNSNDKLPVSLQGSGIFKFLLRISLNQQVIQEKEMRTRDHLFMLDYETSYPGNYQYEITKIGDQHYDLTLKESKIIKYNVIGTPVAKFSTNHLNQCLGIKSSTIELEMAEPLTFGFTLQHEAIDLPQDVRSFSEKFQETNTFSFPPNWSSLSNTDALRHPGIYYLTMTSVENEYGCKNENLNQKLTLEIQESPNLSTAKGHYDRTCAGDYLSFQTQGVAPFEIHTRFFPLKLNRDNAVKGIDSEWGNGADISEEYFDANFHIKEDDGNVFNMLADEPVYYI